MVKAMRRCTPDLHAATDTEPKSDQTARMMDILSSYHDRELRHEGDALRAILGTLRTFEPDSVYHLWGVPLQLAAFQNGDEPGIDQMALVWRSSWDFNDRRPGFPSWSPLGWKYDFWWLWWYRNQNNKLNVRSSQFSSDETYGNSRPVLAQFQEFELCVQQFQERLTLREAITQKVSSIGNISQLLRITGPTVNLCAGPTIKSWGLPDFFTVSMSLANEVDLVLSPIWDIPVHNEMPEGKLYKGLLFEAKSREDRQQTIQFLIIVRLLEDFYTRVGILRFPKDLAFCSWKTLRCGDLDESWCRFNYPRYWTENDRPFRYADDGPDEELEFDPETETLNFRYPLDEQPLDVSELELTSEDWWRPFFEKETIVLG